MRTLGLAALCMLLLAGCSSPDDGGDEPASSTTTAPPTSTMAPPTLSSYNITTSDTPVAPLEAGSQFRFNSTITGNVSRSSDHIGAHFGNQTSTAPSTTVYNVACVHTTGQLPGRYTVTCTAPQEAGTYFLRAHARITQGDLIVNWWSDETSFTVVPLQP